MNQDEQIQNLKDIIKNQDEQIELYKQMIEIYKEEETKTKNSYNNIIKKYKELISIYKSENMIKDTCILFNSRYIEFLRSLNFYL